jgi:hypothetical protein
LERFIDNDLIKAAEPEFRKYSRASTADLEKEQKKSQKY